MKYESVRWVIFMRVEIMAAEVLQATLDYLEKIVGFAILCKLNWLTAEEWLTAFIGKLMAQLQLLGE